jgi:hypothetical protein
MELILIFLIKKVKAKADELNHNGILYINLLVLLWLAGELLGFFLGSRLVSSGWLIYLIAASCGAGAGMLVYCKVMSLEQRTPDYFDLRQSREYPYLNEDPELLSSKAERIEVLKERNKPKAESLPLNPIPQANVVLKANSNLDQKPEFKPELRPEIKSENKPANKPETAIGFKVQNDAGNQSSVATNNNIFQFPYSELLSVNELIVSVYGNQTVKERSIAECKWFDKFKAKYENREIKAALIVLENALYEDPDNGLIWLLFGVLYKDVYRDFNKALQFCLTGAKRCNSYKIALLTEAAELLLFGKKDLVNAFKFFCWAIIAITENSKAWGNPKVDGCIAQERAFHFIRVLLTAFNFNDYRLYLERNIRFSTGMDQTLIENVLAICAESPFRTEIEQQIPQMFPLIIEKLQALG